MQGQAEATEGTLWRRLKPTPLIADRKAASARMKDLQEAARDDARLTQLLSDANVGALLGGVGNYQQLREAAQNASASSSAPSSSAN